MENTADQKPTPAADRAIVAFLQIIEFTNKYGPLVHANGMQDAKSGKFHSPEAGWSDMAKGLGWGNAYDIGYRLLYEKYKDGWYGAPYSPAGKTDLDKKDDSK